MSSELPILDQAVVAELRGSVGGDDAFVHELAGAYLAEGATHLEQMAEALSRGDVAGVVRPAHTLKSSSAALGAMRLAEICRGIEYAAREGRADGLGDAIEDAKAAWAVTEEAMRTGGMAV